MKSLGELMFMIFLEALQHVGSEMNTESTGGFTQANDAVNCK
jgi:hypothetical protein